MGQRRPIQRKGAPEYEFGEGLKTHLAQPEGFVLIGGYLIGTWMFGIMPSSCVRFGRTGGRAARQRRGGRYYSFKGGIQWPLVFLQLLVQDCVQYIMHLVEHNASSELYRVSHKPHHRFTNPRLFDVRRATAQPRLWAAC